MSFRLSHRRRNPIYKLNSHDNHGISQSMIYPVCGTPSIWQKEAAVIRPEGLPRMRGEIPWIAQAQELNKVYLPTKEVGARWLIPYARFLRYDNGGFLDRWIKHSIKNHPLRLSAAERRHISRRIYRKRIKAPEERHITNVNNIIDFHVKSFCNCIATLWLYYFFVCHCSANMPHLWCFSLKMMNLFYIILANYNTAHHFYQTSNHPIFHYTILSHSRRAATH